MMNASPAASEPPARAAALDRAARSPGTALASPEEDGGGPSPSPDVVVTLSQGASAADTYDASGRLPGRPRLDDMGADAPDSMAQASESTGGGGAADSPDAGVDQAV